MARSRPGCAPPAEVPTLIHEPGFGRSYRSEQQARRFGRKDFCAELTKSVAPRLARLY
jgi:hypothetical protein